MAYSEQSLLQQLEWVMQQIVSGLEEKIRALQGNSIEVYILEIWTRWLRPLVPTILIFFYMYWQCVQTEEIKINFVPNGDTFPVILTTWVEEYSRHKITGSVNLKILWAHLDGVNSGDGSISSFCLIEFPLKEKINSSCNYIWQKEEWEIVFSKIS